MTYLLTGLTLGFAAGISPGPLMTLVITRTLERGLGAGLRVAVAPLLTDLPIIAASLIFFAALPSALEILLTIGGSPIWRRCKGGGFPPTSGRAWSSTFSAHTRGSSGSAWPRRC